MLTFIQDQAGTLEVYPSGRAASATVTVYKPGGGELIASSSATVDSTSTTISGTPTSNQVFAVASASGLSVGISYALESATEGSSVVEIAEISGTTITLAQPASFDLASGDALRGLRLTKALTSANTADRALHYRADWIVTPADGGDVQSFRTMFSIARMQFLPPCTRDTVLRYLSFQFPSAIARYNGEEMANLAARASARVTRLVESTGRAPELVGRADLFADAGLLALKLVLADDGLVPQAGTIDLLEFTDSTRRSLQQAVTEAVRAAQWYDHDDDGVVDQNRLEVGPFAMRIVL